MNKSQLVDVLAERLGDRRTAATAVDGLLETIVDTVRSGDSVALTGFGVFEGRARAARTGRNPRTGEPMELPATTVPAFRPGAGFRTAVGSTPASAAESVSPGAVAVTAAPVQQRKAKADASFAGKAEKAEKAAKPAKKAAKGKPEKPKKGKAKK